MVVRSTPTSRATSLVVNNNSQVFISFATLLPSTTRWDTGTAILDRSEVLAGEQILVTQKTPPHTVVDAVEDWTSLASKRSARTRPAMTIPSGQSSQ
jgi:hypothetical protein